MPVRLERRESLHRSERLTPTDPPGQTSLTYTPDGKYLLTAGTNNFIRKFVTASTDEPVTIDTADGNNSAIVASVPSRSGRAS